MIPEAELDLLCGTINIALDFAEAGEVSEGYRVLELGLRWAETPPLDPRTGEWQPRDAWTAELALHYREALVEYAREFGPALAPPPTVKLRPELVATVTWGRRVREEAQDLCAQSRLLRARCASMALDHRSRKLVG